MRLHRFYLPPHNIELTQEFWVHNVELRNQWLKVFRYRVGSEIILFDGVETERLYRIVQVEEDGVKVQLVTEFERKLPDRHIYLFFSLLKKDKNEWVIQKCTELGVRNFVPIIAERSEKTRFQIERAEKIIIEAAEQCGRSDIPHVREPISITEAVKEYGEKVQIFLCDEREEQGDIIVADPAGILIGPEGGWTEQELSVFKAAGIMGINLGKLTLRAETAAVTASAKLLQ